MNREDWVFEFMNIARDDPRIARAHISLYISLWTLWKERDYKIPLPFFSYEVMPLCKTSSFSNYHKILHELHEFGYIKYVPSYNHFLGSRVEFVKLKC